MITCAVRFVTKDVCCWDTVYVQRWKYGKCVLQCVFQWLCLFLGEDCGMC